MKSRDGKPPKKPYHRPRLLVYGDLRTLTRGVSFKGPWDSPAMAGMTTMS